MSSECPNSLVHSPCHLSWAGTAVGLDDILRIYWRLGRPALEDYHKTDEDTVAKSFAASAAALQAQFVLNTGDNFYYYGVKSTTDPCGRILLSKFITKIV